MMRALWSLFEPEESRDGNMRVFAVTKRLFPVLFVSFHCCGEAKPFADLAVDHCVKKRAIR